MANLAKIHPIIHDAAYDYTLPSWAVVSDARRSHVESVGRLLGNWSRALKLEKNVQAQWRAAGVLHDALKGVDPNSLRREVGNSDVWSDPLLHGPACASRLRKAGVEDERLLQAIAYHTTGHPSFGSLGQALFIADYLEPGRRKIVRKRAEWRRRMPLDWHAVLEEVAASKIMKLLERRLPIPQVTVEFWRRITDGSK